MKTHGTLLLLVGTLTLAAAAPTPRQHLPHRELQQTTQPEYEYDYEGTAAQAAEPDESASHYDTYIAQVQQANADKKGYSRGSGLRTIAVGSANQAKTALGNQAAAGYQAAYVAKNTLAQSAAQASATAQAALAGKQVILSGLEQQVRDAKVALQGEEMQLQQAKRAAQSAAQAAQQAMHQVNVIQAALNAAQATSEHANEAASQAAGELGAQTAMVGAAKQRVSTLQEQLHGVRIDFEATQAAARKAQGAAQQAQANAAEAAAKAAAAGLGGHKDAAYEAQPPQSEEESKEEPQTTKKLIITSTTPTTTTTTKCTTRAATTTTTYSNTGPVKFEFIIPPLLEDIKYNLEPIVSIRNELGKDNESATKPTELDPENNELLTTRANINSTLDTIRYNISRNKSRSETHVKRRQISENDFKNEIKNELEQMLIRSRKSNHKGAYKLKHSLPTVTQLPHTTYWLDTTKHEAHENNRNDPNSEEYPPLKASKHIYHALQRSSFREPKSTQPEKEVNRDTPSTTLTPAIKGHHAGYPSEHRYNPSKHELLRDPYTYQTYQYNDKQNKNTTLATRNEHTLSHPRISRTTETNFYLKRHTIKFIYKPRYQFHHNTDNSKRKAQLKIIKPVYLNTSYTISNLSDPDYKRSHNRSALSNTTPTPPKTLSFHQIIESHGIHEDPVDETDIQFDEIHSPQENPSVVEKTLQNALYKAPKYTRPGQSSSLTLNTPTPYEPWHITYQPSPYFKPHQGYAKIYAQLNNALEKYKVSEAEEPQQQHEEAEEDCQEEN